MVIEKVFFGILAVLLVWMLYPHVRSNEFIAPNPLPPNSWITDIDQSARAQALSYPPDGYGFRRFDFWNESSPDTGRPVTREDFQLRYK